MSTISKTTKQKKEPELSAFTHKYSVGDQSNSGAKSTLATSRHQRILQEYYEHKRANESKTRKGDTKQTQETTSSPRSSQEINFPLSSQREMVGT